MPAKKEAVALQKEVCNQEQWDDLMGGEGLYVVDVYQRWCGPCTAVVSLFRRLKNEIGDDLLKYAVAKADNIENLEKYRGHCEPCFLFYGSGQLVDVVRGANGPALFKSITAQLAAEHRVLEEGAERKLIKDPLLMAMEAKEQAAAEIEAVEKRKQEEESQIGDIICGEEKCEDISIRPVSEKTVQLMFSDIQNYGSRSRAGQEPVPKEVTVVLVKPDAVSEGKVEEIIQKLVENGLEVLAQEEKVLTEDEARDFYKEHEEEEHFESLVQFMSSGPCHILVLTKGDTGEGVVHEVRNLIGPKDVEIAKEEAPESLRALYGTDKTMNALHGADSAERAARELSFFFPGFAVPIVPGTGPPPMVQKTFALIRPDALKDHKDSILDKIKEAGFDVCLQKEVQLTEEQAKEFYKQQEGQPHFDELIIHMTSGPVLALGLAKEEAIQNWRNMLGPKEVEVAKQEAPDSLRAQFSLTDSTINCVHGSDSVESASKELNYFFPTEHTLAVIKPDASVEHKDAIIERIHEAGFNIACQKNIELNRELAEQLYKEHEGKEFFDSLLDHMTSGPSMIMVLSREDAIKGWRTIMGPTDPELAKEQAPESLRALLGKDVLSNAIHGSSTKEHAEDKIKKLFPEVDINSDGSLTDMDWNAQNTDANQESPTQDQQPMHSVAGEEQEAAEQDGEGKEQTPAQGEADVPADAAEGNATEPQADAGDAPVEAPTAEESQQESQEPQGGDTVVQEGGEGEQEGGEREVRKGEGEVAVEGPRVEEGDNDQLVEDKQSVDETLMNQEQGELEEAKHSSEIQEQSAEDVDQTEPTEPTADEDEEPLAQKVAPVEPAQKEGQQEDEQPVADQSDGEAAPDGGDATEQTANELIAEPTAEETPAAEETPTAEETPMAEEIAAEETPAAEEVPAAEETPAAEEMAAAEETAEVEEQQAAAEDKVANEPKPAAEQAQDEKPSEEAAPEPEGAAQEGKETEEKKQGLAAEDGEGQKEEIAPEGADEKKEDPPAE